MTGEKRYAFESLENCRQLDETDERLRKHGELFRKHTLPRLEEMQSAKELGAQKAAKYLLG